MIKSTLLGRVFGAVSRGASKASQYLAQKAWPGLAQAAQSGAKAGLGTKALQSGSGAAQWVARNPEAATGLAAGTVAGGLGAAALQRKEAGEKIGGSIGQEFTWPPET